MVVTVDAGARLKRWQVFLCGPYGLAIVFLIVSPIFINQEIGFGDWVWYWGLDTCLLVVASILTWKRLIVFTSEVRNEALFMDSRNSLIVMTALMIIYIVCASRLTGLGALGDSRHEVFKMYRNLDQVYRFSSMGLDAFIWFSPFSKSIVIALFKVVVSGTWGFSKGTLVLQALTMFPLYFIKWQFSIRKKYRIGVIALVGITMAATLYYTQTVSNKFGIDSSLILSTGLKRMFFPNDIYADYYNLPVGMIARESISPLIFLEPLTKIFYDETPHGTIGSILRSGSEVPGIATGGTPYISLHLAFLQYSNLMLVLGFVFLLCMFGLTCLLANNPLKLQPQISWTLIGIPGAYVNDYSGMSMSLAQIAALYVVFSLLRPHFRPIANRQS